MELQEYRLSTEEKQNRVSEVNAGEAEQFKQMKFKKDSYIAKWLKNCLSTEFLFEVLLLIIHPIPQYDKEYTFYILNMLGSKDQYVPVKYMLGDFLFAFMFFRVYFLIRTIMNFSSYSDLYSKKICINN